MTTKPRTTRQALAEIDNERWAAMSPAGRMRCRTAYRWMRRGGMDRQLAHAVVDSCTLAGEGAGWHRAVAR